jgi:hypothetical protein
VLTRRPNWQRLLDLYLRSQQHTKFRYGSHDCCLFACDAVQEMTGTDIAAPFRGQYESRDEAYRAIKAYAGRASVEAIGERIAAEHGMPEANPLNAQRGDVILVDRPRDFSLAVVGLRGEFLAASRRGFEIVPSCMAIRAWHV